MYSSVIELQIANGDILLEQHIKKNPSNAQYTSKLFDEFRSCVPVPVCSVCACWYLYMCVVCVHAGTCTCV